MDYSVIGTAIGIIAGLFIVVGLIFGLIRGWAKSTLRIGLVLVVVLLTALITPAISKGLLNTDISKFGVSVNGSNVSTVSALITGLLGDYGVDQATLNSMPTFKELLEKLPMVILNVVVFIVLFFALLFLTLIIYWILAAIFFPKRKRAVRKKLPAVGAAIGALQGLIVFVVFMIPTIGVVNMANEFLEITNTSNQAVVQPVDSSVEENVIEDHIILLSQNTNTVANEDENVDATNELRKAVDAFKDCFVVKALDAVGYSKLANSVYNNLTTVEINKVKVKLSEELYNTAEIISIASNMGSFKEDLTEQQIADMNAIIDKMFESKIIGRVMGEIIPVATTKWSNGEKFIIEKPSAGEDVQPLIDSLCEAFSDSTPESLKSDMHAVVNVLEVANKYGMIKIMFGDSDVDLLAQINKAGFGRDMISAILSSETLKEIFPSVLDFGMQEVYKVVGLENPSQYKIVLKSSDLTDAEWQTEKETLGLMIDSLVDFVASLNNVDGVTIDNIDMSVLGNIFNSMRSSKFLGANSKVVVVNMLKSDFVNGAIPVAFINKVESDWETINFVATFNVVKASLDMNQQISSGETVNAETVKVLLENLGQDGMDEVISELASKENLKDMGLEEDTAGAVNEVLTNISTGIQGEDVDYEKEAAAMDTMMNTFNNISSGSEEIVTQDNAKDIVDSLSESDVILNAMTESDHAESISETLKTEVSSDQKTLLENELNAKASQLNGQGEVTEQQKAKLEQVAGLFGIDWTFPVV